MWFYIGPTNSPPHINCVQNLRGACPHSLFRLPSILLYNGSSCSDLTEQAISTGGSWILIQKRCILTVEALYYRQPNIKKVTCMIINITAKISCFNLYWQQVWLPQLQHAYSLMITTTSHEMCRISLKEYFKRQ